MKIDGLDKIYITSSILAIIIYIYIPLLFNKKNKNYARDTMYSAWRAISSISKLFKKQKKKVKNEKDNICKLNEFRTQAQVSKLRKKRNNSWTVLQRRTANAKTCQRNASACESSGSTLRRHCIGRAKQAGLSRPKRVQEVRPKENCGNKAKTNRTTTTTITGTKSKSNSKPTTKTRKK